MELIDPQRANAMGDVVLGRLAIVLSIAFMSGAWRAGTAQSAVASAQPARSTLPVAGDLPAKPSPLVRAIRQRIPDEEAAWMRRAVREQLRGCRIRGPGDVWLYTPDGVGNYRALWTRDFAYMVQYAGDLIQPQDVEACIRCLASGQRADGCMPDRVTAAGRAVYSPGSRQRPLADHALDNGAFMALLVCAHVARHGHWAFFRQLESGLRRGLDHTRRAANGLVYNPPESPQCPYGFTDTVAKTGHLLFCSLLYHDACRRMADACRRARWSDPGEYDRRADAIRRSLHLLWNEEAGMFWAADRDCKQIDIWGSALAVQLGCATRAQADRIAEYLVRHYDEVVQRGQVRHLPAGQAWQRMLAPIRPGTYQNGAFWATPVAWVAPTIARRDLDLAARMVRDVIADFRQRGIAECVNGPRRRVLNYVASAANVYYLVRP
ncbi:MAG TPA: hypothetical protein EYP56_20915 [Planctomycetaceae bacterium]|nr:hypothetical protein [Planctomycetaceae bacterium]